MNQPNIRKRYHRGTLRRFRELMQTCRERTTKGFAALLQVMMDRIDSDLRELAAKASNDAFANQCLDAIHELQLRRIEIEQDFFHGIAESFLNFDRGRLALDEEEPRTKGKAGLSLVAKDEDEINALLTTLVSNALYEFSEPLYILNQRLALVNGGTKLGEASPAFPGGPFTVCKVFRAAVGKFDFDLPVLLALFELFDKAVMRQARSVYEEFNAVLVRGGVLPDLRYGSAAPAPAESPIVTQEPADASVPAPDLDADAEVLRQELFQGITQILSRNRSQSWSPDSSTPPVTAGMVPTNVPETPRGMPELLLTLDQLQRSLVPPPLDQMASLQSIREAFTQQSAKLSEALRGQQVSHADADVIDLVGMLFEFILDDRNLPDTVKAALSYLHTPYLKVAVLDKKFFVRSQHPARKLLNAMSQAGALYSPGDNNAMSVLAKIQSTVNRVVKDFNEDTSLFAELLDDFNEFMNATNKRSVLMEKRSVEAARGREKLQEARRTVSHEIVNRSLEYPLPESVETLLFGPWAGFLVITLLRTGAQSPEWKAALKVTDDLIWSVIPKDSDEERETLRRLLPALIDAVRAGLEMAGDVTVDIQKVLRQLESCHKSVLVVRKPSSTVRRSDEASASVTGFAYGGAERLQKLREIIPEEWQEHLPAETTDSPGSGAEISAEKQALIEQLKGVEFGTWFEFIDQEKEITQRGKLAWINTSTSNYMFVNQGGRQIAVKPLHRLADDIEAGRARLLTMEKTPFVDRALKSIHGLLNKS